MARKKSVKKYEPDAVATLMTDLKRTGLWIGISIAVVVALAFTIETVL